MKQVLLKFLFAKDTEPHDGVCGFAPRPHVPFAPNYSKRKNGSFSCITSAFLTQVSIQCPTVCRTTGHASNFHNFQRPGMYERSTQLLSTRERNLALISSRNIAGKSLPEVSSQTNSRFFQDQLVQSQQHRDSLVPSSDFGICF